MQQPTFIYTLSKLVVGTSKFTTRPNSLFSSAYLLSKNPTLRFYSVCSSFRPSCKLFLPSSTCTSTHLLTPSLFNTASSSRSIATTLHYYAEKSTKRTDLNYDDLCLAIDTKELQLFDVRDANEITDSPMLPNAVNIPLSSLKESLQLEPPAFELKYGVKKPELLSKNIVFYGFGSVRSSAAVEIAHKLGFKKARHYPGGLDEWSKETGIPPKKEQTSV